MPFYERGPVRIYYEVVGSGFPLLLIPGGGLNSALSAWQTAPFNPMKEERGQVLKLENSRFKTNRGQATFSYSSPITRH